MSNSQRHFVIKLSDLDTSGDVLRIGTDTKINFRLVAREGFTTDVTSSSNISATVDLVNDASDDSNLEWDLLQGSLSSGMKYYTNSNSNSVGSEAETCIRFNSNLDPDNTSIVSDGCGTISTKPSATSDMDTFTNAPNEYLYLPSSGQTYETIDLRVNFFSIFNDYFDPSWIADLEVD